MADNSTSLIRNPGKADSPTVRGSEGAGTTVLSRTDSFWQIFNLTAARTVLLPSVGVKAGDQIRLDLRSLFTLTVQAANASQIAVMSTVGYGTWVALIDSPAASTDWLSAGTFSSGTYTPTLSLAANANTLSANVTQWMRVGDIVTVSGLLSVNKPASGSAAFSFSLPVAANVAMTQGMCGGVATDTGTVNTMPSWKVDGGSSTTTTVRFGTSHSYTGNIDMVFTFTYRLNA